MPRRELHFCEQVRLYRYRHLISRIALREDAWGRHAVDALIYAMLSVTRIEEGWSRWRFAMQSNYSTGTARREQRWWAERSPKKGPRTADERQKTDCENLRIPLLAQSDEKRGSLQFSSEIYDGRSRKLNTDPRIYNVQWWNGCAPRRDNNLQWTLCCRSITAIDGIYPRGTGAKRNVISIPRTFRYQLGNLLKVLSEFHNAVKVCRLNDGV